MSDGKMKLKIERNEVNTRSRNLNLLPVRAFYRHGTLFTNGRFLSDDSLLSTEGDRAHSP